MDYQSSLVLLDRFEFGVDFSKLEGEVGYRDLVEETDCYENKKVLASTATAEKCFVFVVH